MELEELIFGGLLHAPRLAFALLACRVPTMMDRTWKLSVGSRRHSRNRRFNS
jgi:hypothetical protein